MFKKDVLKGFADYRKIADEYGKDVAIFTTAWRGTGDYFICGLYLQEYLQDFVEMLLNLYHNLLVMSAALMNGKKNDLAKEKTVLLSPHSTGLKQYEIPWEFWNGLAVVLKNEGYSLVTNCAVS